MFSTKKNVLQTVALLKAYGVKHIVLSPGSRNSPLIHTFSKDSFFHCHIIVDERNAAFYGLGIMQSLQEPVAICCTSGTALLNYAPAVAEAFYQQLPLIIVSADRSQEWIGQMDGQTIPQPNAFYSLVKKSVQLPEINTNVDEWYCNRLINEALIACTKDCPGPVHINIPISEPLFDYSQKELPEVRVIKHAAIKKSVDIAPFAKRWEAMPKRIIIVGQLPKSEILVNTLEHLVEKCNCVVLAEELSNCVSPLFVTNFDSLLSIIPESEIENYSPDLLLTLGGHLVSKRIKQFLRNYKPKQHWHFSPSGEVTDLFQSLTDLLEADYLSFFNDLLEIVSTEKDRSYLDLWINNYKINEPAEQIEFSDIWAVGRFLKALPKNSALHLANSSSVRNAQFFELDKSTNVYCNRGTNGIESSLPSAIGFASVYAGNVYLIIGDLSFFYTLSSLWNIEHIKNLRILLINNGGGGIFHLLQGQKQAESLGKYVAAGHQNKAQAWAHAAGLNYMWAENKDQFDECLKLFISPEKKQSILFEISTDTETGKKVFNEYYQHLKKINI